MAARHMFFLLVECPMCGFAGRASDVITRGWDGRTYGFACGHEAHLNEKRGGAKTWIEELAEGGVARTGPDDAATSSTPDGGASRRTPPANEAAPRDGECIHP